MFSEFLVVRFKPERKLILGMLNSCMASYP
uniref:Uncharacterized protein n=1 Tax=Arundo donax TaxID=35708 RepID=A0A0A8XZC1_ARUDO